MANKSFLTFLSEVGTLLVSNHDLPMTPEERYDFDTLFRVYSLILESVNRSLKDLAK